MSIDQMISESMRTYLDNLKDIVFEYIYFNYSTDELEKLKKFKQENLDIFLNFIDQTADSCFFMGYRKELILEMIKSRSDLFKDTFDIGEKK